MYWIIIIHRNCFLPKAKVKFTLIYDWRSRMAKPHICCKRNIDIAPVNTEHRFVMVHNHWRLRMTQMTLYQLYACLYMYADIKINSTPNTCMLFQDLHTLNWYTAMQCVNLLHFMYVHSCASKSNEPNTTWFLSTTKHYPNISILKRYP